MAREPGLRPHYVTTSRGQIRLWLNGEGPNLVVLPGLVRSAQSVAKTLAHCIPGWRVIAVEMPGTGYSSGVAPRTVEDMAESVAEALAWLGDEPCVIAGHDLAAPVCARLVHRGQFDARAGFAIDRWSASGWKRSAVMPPDLSLRGDGTHLIALWSFIRDRHLLVPDNPSLPAADGGPVPAVEELSDAFIGAAQHPEGYAAAWAMCADAVEEADNLADVRDAAGLAGALQALQLPDGVALPPPAEALPAPSIWYDYVETARGRIHLRRAGAEGDPLLVIPTGGGSSAQFAPVITGLAQGRRVFAVDYPGNGLSAPPAGEVSTATLAQDMLALLDAMGIDQADVWGSHTGSLVALEMAVIAPERVGRIVMEGPVFIAPDFQTDLLTNYFLDFTPDKWGQHLLAIWNWRRDMFMYWPWYNVERSAARKLGVPAAGDLHLYALGIVESGPTYDRAYRTAFSYDTRARLPELSRPALVCAGPNDQLKNGLTEARPVAPAGLVSYAETPTTVWWPDPDPDEARQTLAVYDRFLREGAADDMEPGAS